MSCGYLVMRKPNIRGSDKAAEKHLAKKMEFQNGKGKMCSAPAPMGVQALKLLLHDGSIR
jgi:hypothetical protein